MGQKSVLFETIQSEKSDMEKSLRTMSAAKTQNKQDIFTLESRKVGRSEETIKKLTLIHEKMEFLYKNLDKMKKNVNFLLEDTEDEVRVKKIEYKSIKAAHKAMSAAEALINGDSEKELFEQSMEHLADDIGSKLGEMDRFMDLSKGFMDNVDLQNGVFDIKGMEMLEQWESGADILTYSGGDIKKTTPAVLATKTVAPAKQSQMNSFFK